MIEALWLGGRKGRINRGDCEGPHQAGPCGCYEDVGFTLRGEPWRVRSEGDPDSI